MPPTPTVNRVVQPRIPATAGVRESSSLSTGVRTCRSRCAAWWPAHLVLLAAWTPIARQLEALAGQAPAA
jgi:hypothetical protein